MVILVRFPTPGFLLAMKQMQGQASDGSPLVRGLGRDQASSLGRPSDRRMA